MDDNAVITHVCGKLNEAGKALRDEDPFKTGTKQLANLQPCLDRAVRDKSDAQARFILFFLSTLIEDIRYNLLADFPFSADPTGTLLALRRRFFVSLGDGLTKLSQVLMLSKFHDC